MTASKHVKNAYIISYKEIYQAYKEIIYLMYIPDGIYF